MVHFNDILGVTTSILSLGEASVGGGGFTQLYVFRGTGTVFLNRGVSSLTVLAHCENPQAIR